MKKPLQSLTIAIGIFFILIGFGFNSWEEIELGSATQKPSVTTNQTKKPTASVAPSISSGASDEQNTSPTPTPFVSLPIVLLDNEYCKVEAIGFNENSSYNWGLSKGFELQLRMQNKAEDKTIRITSDNEYINGIKYSDWEFSLSSTIAPEKKDIKSLYISSSTIVYDAIDFVRDIEFDLKVYDSDTYDDYCKETVNIYPYGKTYAVPYERGFNESDITLFDNEYVTIIATKFGKSTTLLTDYYVMRFWVVNKTDKKISIDFENISVNGYMANSYCYNTLKAKKSDFDVIKFSNSYLEEKEIETVEEIEFTLTVKDYDDYKNKFVEEVIIVKAPN